MTRWIVLGISVLLYSGCASTQENYEVAPSESTLITDDNASTLPSQKNNTYKKPHIHHTLKKVEDNNFSPEYMYPETKEITQKPSTSSISSASSQPEVTAMSKEACMEMIGEEKFEHYTEMLGSESGAIKRCKLLKSMQ